MVIFYVTILIGAYLIRLGYYVYLRIIYLSVEVFVFHKTFVFVFLCL